MGALLIEAVLQAGIRYDTVVRPRVEAVLTTYPAEKTTSEFQRVLMIEGALNVLDCKLDRKINTLVDVTQFFVSEQVESVDRLRAEDTAVLIEMLRSGKAAKSDADSRAVTAVLERR